MLMLATNMTLYCSTVIIITMNEETWISTPYPFPGTPSTSSWKYDQSAQTTFRLCKSQTLHLYNHSSLNMATSPWIKQPIFSIILQPAFEISTGQYCLWEMATRFCELREPLTMHAVCYGYVIDVHIITLHISIVSIQMYDVVCAHSCTTHDGTLPCTLTCTCKRLPVYAMVNNQSRSRVSVCQDVQLKLYFIE